MANLSYLRDVARAEGLGHLLARPLGERSTAGVLDRTARSIVAWAVERLGASSVADLCSEGTAALLEKRFSRYDLGRLGSALERWMIEADDDALFVRPIVAPVD